MLERPSTSGLMPQTRKTGRLGRLAVGLLALAGAVVWLWGSSKTALKPPLAPPVRRNMRLHASLWPWKDNFQLDFNNTYSVCTVGAGLTGTVLAERFATVLGKRVLVLDVRKHIGGTCYDFIDPATGILMSKYGARRLQTNDERVWRYINQHPRSRQWIRWQNDVRLRIGGKLVPFATTAAALSTLGLAIPTQREVRALLEKASMPCEKEGCENNEEIMLSVARSKLYENLEQNVTTKVFNKELKDLSAKATALTGVTSLSEEAVPIYEALPSGGYTNWFLALLDHPLIDIALDTDFFKHRKHLEKVCELIVYTGRIDSYFSLSALGKLEYRSLKFAERRFYDTGYVQPVSTILYPSRETKLFRSVEYKHLYFQNHLPHSVVVEEIPSNDGEPFFPVPTSENIQLYRKYETLASQVEKAGRVVFAGPLTKFTYFSMGETIAKALELFYQRHRELELPSFMKPSPPGALTAEAMRSPKPALRPAPNPVPKQPPHSSPKIAGSAVIKPKWISYVNRPESSVTWQVGKALVQCFGLRKKASFPLTHPLRTDADLKGSKVHSTQKTVNEAKIAILLRGHFRDTDRNPHAAEGIRDLLQFFPNAKVFVQTWSSRQTSFSWRQNKRDEAKLNMTLGSLNAEILQNYYRIPDANLGGVIILSEDKVLPELRKLYHTEDLNTRLCEGFVPLEEKTGAPNIGWLQMWWGILQGTALIKSKDQFEAVLSMRHDAWIVRLFEEVLQNSTALRDVLAKYLEVANDSPTDAVCFTLNRLLLKENEAVGLRYGVDTAYVTGPSSMHHLATKWVYSYKTMEAVLCQAKNEKGVQEELVELSASLLV